ncbi:MAG TPA: efflux RND transporter periplasmic adaptor subunit [Verrucomicrobiae bacterium]|jgi:HlyD family secretion protein|nr:efflux RND transporter periplasmic adaptor subunit [Verrucomicrobiae bacterium]
MRGSLKLMATGILILAILAGVGAWQWRAHAAHKPSFREATVKKGDLYVSITATGTVEPEEVVDVGAQVAGQVNVFGKDKNGKTIDYGSVVESNMVLAQIDDSLYAADVALGKAQLDQDKAGEVRAEADLEQMKAKLVQAEADWNRAQKLGPSEALAPTTYDSYKANYEIAKANVDLDEAALKQARATTVAAAATLDKSQRTLDYCTITSPVNGVIIDRRVTIGETVVSSFNTPSLFLIARDLTRMQVWISVNEADIGSIHPGQQVTFTVDAFPNRTFRGTVGKVRLNATMTQNVVTYTVEVNTDNSDGKLLPYLTANAQFLTGERHQVLLVPNAALRWRPQADLIAPESREAAMSRHSPADGDDSDHKGTVWVEDGDFVKPVEVTTGLTDETMMEIEGAGITDGTHVVLGVQLPGVATDSDDADNPFAPKNPWARRRIHRTNSP